MLYDVEFKPKAIKDLKKIPKNDSNRILTRIEDLTNNLKGDVKRLTNFTPEYRLRVGNYRVLFEIDNSGIIMIYRIIKRENAYR